MAALPSLSRAAGLERALTARLTQADQLVFLLCDLAFGLLADGAARSFRRFAPALLSLAFLGAGLFALLPRVTSAGPGALLAVALLWSAAISALRAPALSLLAQRASPSGGALLALAWPLSLAVAAGLAPALAARVRASSPTGPFLLGTGATVLATVALLVALPREDAEPEGFHPVPPPVRAGAVFRLTMASFSGSLAWQLSSVFAAPALLRARGGAALVEGSAPALGIAMAVGALLAAALRARLGAYRLGALALGAALLGGLLAPASPSEGALLACLLASSAAWGALGFAVQGAALAVGGLRRKGSVLGAVYGAAAGATLARMLLAPGTERAVRFEVPLAAGLLGLGFFLAAARWDAGEDALSRG